MATAAPAENPLPVIVTAVPPPVVPRDGDTDITAIRGVVGAVGDEQPERMSAAQSGMGIARRRPRPTAVTDETIELTMIAELRRQPRCAFVRGDRCAAA